MSSVANSMPPTAVELNPRQQPPWLTIAWFSILLIACYFPVLSQLVHKWYNDEDMGHGFFVPVIAGYIAWQNRDKLLAIDVRPNYWGLAIVLFSGFQLYIATLGAELFTTRMAFIEAVVGTVLFLGGTQALKILAFPLMLLVFMVPIPAIIYNRITFPLQLFASQVAASALELLGVPVLRDGNVLELPSQKLSVVEACSGIRSLLSLTFLSLVYSYFFDQRRWMRWVLFLCTIPIAIVANAGRVTLTGIMSEIRPDLATGLPHEMSGWVIFMIALGMLIFVHQLISKVANAYVLSKQPK
jgi:exosortase